MKSLTRLANDYLALRRSLGFKLFGAEGVLHRFLAYMEQEHHTHITVDAVLQWVHTGNLSPMTISGRFTLLRKFAEYAHAIDEAHEVPATRLVLNSTHRATPHIYSREQTLRILHGCRTLPFVGNGLRRSTYYTALGLLVVTGMRISELTSLKRQDVNPESGLLLIRESKFKNTRAIPLHGTTVGVLSEYARLRDELFPGVTCDAFFLADGGEALSKPAMETMFVRISHRIGLRKPNQSFGPRIHDFRHTFAVNTLTRWYREGADVEQRLPILSAYLGHVKPSDTYWYLSAVPELVGLVAARMDAYQEGRR